MKESIKKSDDAVVAATPIRIVVADDHPVVRKGLRLLLEQYPELVVRVLAVYEKARLYALANPDELRADLARRLGRHPRDAETVRRQLNVILIHTIPSDFRTLLASAVSSL